MNIGIVHVFGPVLDPGGIYGFGVVSAEGEEQLKKFIYNDPALTVNRLNTILCLLW